MKQTISFSSEEIAKAALEDAKNYKLEASLDKKDEIFEISYESLAYSDIASKPANPTWDDFYALSSGMAQEMQYQIKWLKEDMKYTTDMFYKHMEGHIPPIKDIGKLNKAIEVLGIADNYVVEKKRVYVEW